MSVCKYCNQEKPLCKAHIIPQAFYKQIWSDNRHPLLCKIKLGSPKQKMSSIGLYDSNILCSDCDGKFGKFDEEGINFFRNINFDLYKHNISSEYFYKVPNSEYNYLKLKKFFISVIYRASISKLPEFSSVNLGDKFEAEVVNFLKNDNDNEHFSILLQKRSSVTEIPVDKIILTPGRFRLQAINAYDVHLSGLRAIIKVDSRPFPTLFRTFELNSLYAFIFHSILEETNDYQFFTQYVQEQSFYLRSEFMPML